MHRLSSSFVLGYHGCTDEVGKRLLNGERFKPSNNDYDWLGPGIYFWEANPLRGLDFADEAIRRNGKGGKPFVVGAVIELGQCLDLMTYAGVRMAQAGYEALRVSMEELGCALPENSKDGSRRKLDCAVVQRAHTIAQKMGIRIDTVRGVFVEGNPAYPGGRIEAKTHVQIAVCNPTCIKAVFRVPEEQLVPFDTTT